MGVLSSVFDADERGRAAARTRTAVDFRRVALDGANWVSVAIDADVVVEFAEKKDRGARAAHGIGGGGVLDERLHHRQLR